MTIRVVKYGETEKNVPKKKVFKERVNQLTK